jgi:hypothetical protein
MGGSQLGIAVSLEDHFEAWKIYKRSMASQQL